MIELGEVIGELRRELQQRPDAARLPAQRPGPGAAPTFPGWNRPT
jgi:hypothetical protein